MTERARQPGPLSDLPGQRLLGAGCVSGSPARVAGSNVAAPLLVTVEQAADILGLGRTTLYELTHRGELHPVHAGRALRFPVAELERFVDALMDAPNGP